MTLSVFVSYGLQCYVSVDIVWTEYLGAKMEVHPKKIMYKYVVQTSLVLLTCKKLVKLRPIKQSPSDYNFVSWHKSDLGIKLIVITLNFSFCII